MGENNDDEEVKDGAPEPQPRRSPTSVSRRLRRKTTDAPDEKAQDEKAEGEVKRRKLAGVDGPKAKAPKTRGRRVATPAARGPRVPGPMGPKLNSQGSKGPWVQPRSGPIWGLLGLILFEARALPSLYGLYRGPMDEGMRMK